PWTARSDVSLAGRTFPGVAWETRSFQSPPYYGVRAAHFFSEESGWGLALDFFHDKAYAADGSIAPALRRLSFSHGLNHVTVDVDWRTRAGRSAPTAAWAQVPSCRTSRRNQTPPRSTSTNGSAASRRGHKSACSGACRGRRAYFSSIG